MYYDALRTTPSAPKVQHLELVLDGENSFQIYLNENRALILLHFAQILMPPSNQALEHSGT